ncbi:microsomal triglyceride transfer protein large subunit-like [Latimeria chalumnae]|uniref:microsomal triglyceride transfer protein large subunit-like n=1 Tax=Latimeria chalumnae TaxID=7897 RepID=UPI0003C1171A
MEHASSPTLTGSGFKAEATLKTFVVWRNNSNLEEQLIHLQIDEVKFLNISEREENKNIFKDISADALLGQENVAALRTPLLFHWNLGKVKGIYSPEETNTKIQDFKKGLVYLFQLQLYSGTVTEVDLSGKCRVTYDISTDKVKKIKDLHSCQKPKFGFSSVTKVFDVDWQPTSTSHYSLEKSLIKSVVAEESHLIVLNLKSTTSAKISSRQQLQLLSLEQGPAENSEISLQETLTGLPANYKLLDANATSAKSPCTDCPLLRDYLKILNKELHPADISRASATKLFLKLVQIIRESRKKEILHAFKKAKDPIIPFLIDAITAAQTEASLSALSEYLDFNNEVHELYLEKFLYASAFSSHPSKELLHILMNKMKGSIANPEIRDTAVIVTGALIGKMCKMKLCKSQEVEDAKEFILSGLEEAQDESEMKIYLLALKNALLPETIPLLLQLTQEMSGAVSVVALSALQRFPAKYINAEVKKEISRIFHQNYYEKSVRLAAVEILLSNNPSYMDITNILLAIGEIGTEMSRFLISKIQNILHTDHPSRKVILEVLKDRLLHNYDRFSRTGSSTSFAGLLGVTQDTVTTYSLDLFFSDSGFLRKSTSDFSLFAHGYHLHASQVSIEVQGLENLMGGEVEEGEEEVDAMAGMSGTLFDIQLRPVVFFQGYSDLMAKFFSASDEPTTVVQGTLLLIDHLQAVSLQSGLQAVFELQGGLGIDISGTIDVSLWNQEAQTSIKTRASLILDMGLNLNASFVKAGITSRSEAETSMDFNTTVNFSNTPMQICLQLQKGHLPFRELLEIHESFPNGKNFTLHKKRKTTVQAVEVPLYQANSEMCKKMFLENL